MLDLENSYYYHPPYVQSCLLCFQLPGVNHSKAKDPPSEESSEGQ